MSTLESARALARETGFMGRLVVEHVDGRTWIVQAGFKFCSENPRVGCVVIPEGFKTDFATIPRFFWRVLDPLHPHIGKAAVIHDRLYKDPSILITREEADAVLSEGMPILGAPEWKRQVVTVGLLIGGEREFVPRAG